MAKVKQAPIDDGKTKKGLWSWFRSRKNTTVDSPEPQPQHIQPVNGQIQAAATPETNHTPEALEAALAEAEAEHDQEYPTLLGIDQQTGNEIVLSEKTRSQLVAISGAMGVGKSIFMAGLIDQDIQQGRSVIVCDPHGPLVRQVIARMSEERLKDVILVDLASENAVGLNLFACPQPRTMQSIAAAANSISHVFEKVFGTSVDRTPRLLGVLRAITRLLIDNDLTMAEIPLLFANDAVRAKMVANCTNSSIVSFWEGYNRRSQRDKDDLVASTMNKIMSFLDHDLLRLIVSQSKTTLDMRRILDEGKILLVSLSPQFQDASTLIGATLISQLLSAMYARGPYPENDIRACALFCDEYASYATEDFATICTEARKFRIFNTLAFQVLETLDDANRATALQAGTLVVFRVSGDDSKVYARSFDSKPTQEQTGWEPVRAVPTDCTSHLLRRSHANPIVTKFVTEYLMPLDTLLKSHPSNQAFGFGVSLFSSTYAIQGQQLLNECLFECMQSGRADGFIPPLALFTLGGAAEPGITAVFYDDIKRDPFFTGHLFLGLYESANRFGQASFLTNTKAVDALVKKHAKRKLYGQVTTPGPSFIAMLKSLRQTMEILGKEPVLVDSGQYRPIYRQRSFNDVEAEVANLIKTQDNYVARVKVLTSEHTIRTAPPPPLLPDEQINDRINYIKNNMLNLGLCKPAHEVEEEVRLRHEKLLAPDQNDSPPPTHTNRRRFRPRPPKEG